MTYHKVGSSDVAGVTRTCGNLKILYTFIPQFSAFEIVLAFSRENAQQMCSSKLFKCSSPQQECWCVFI